MSPKRRNVRLTLTTEGWGGNEIMAAGIARRLHAAGANVIWSASPEQEQKLTGYLGAGLFGAASDRLVADVIVASSYLAGLRYVFRNRASRKLTWIYTPFWGFEWATGWRRTFRVLITKLAFLVAPYRVIAVHHEFGEALGKTNSEKCVVFPNVAMNVATRCGSASGDRETLYCIGRVEFGQKQQDRLLAAVAACKSEGLLVGTKVCFVGDGPDRQALADLIDGLDWAELQPWQNVAQIYSRPGVAVLFSKFEGLPLVALEALSSGMPLIATQASGVAALIPQECILDESPKSLSHAFTWVVENAESALAHGRSRIEQMYSELVLKASISEWLQGLQK